MVFTFICFFIPLLLFSFIIHTSPYPIKQRKSIYICTCIYILIFTWSIFDYSGDYVHYRDSFININSWQDYIVGTALKGYELEPGYVMLNLIVKFFITSEVNYAIGIITLLAGIGYLYYIPKYTNYIFIALVVYIAHFYWWSGIVLIRQMYATVIMFPIINLISNNRYKKSCFLIILASFFHSSAIIFFLFLLFNKKIHIKKKHKFLYIILAFIIGYLNLFKIIISTCASFIPRGEVFLSRYINSEGKSMNMLGIAEMLIILYISLKFRNKLIHHNKYFEIAINLLFFSILLTLCLMRYEIGMRFTQYFNLYSYLIILPTFIGAFKPNLENRTGYIFILGCYMSLFLIRFVYITI